MAREFYRQLISDTIDLLVCKVVGVSHAGSRAITILTKFSIRGAPTCVGRDGEGEGEGEHWLRLLAQRKGDFILADLEQGGDTSLN